MPQEYKEGWICLILILLFGFVITKGIEVAELPKQREKVETQCAPTGHYALNRDGHISEVFDCTDVEIR